MRKKTLYKYTGILWGYFRFFMSKVFIKNLIGRVDDLLVSAKPSMIHPTKPSPIIKTTALMEDTVELTGKVKFSKNILARTTPEQRNILTKLYQHYISISKNKINHPVSATIHKGSLMHSQNFDIKTLRETLENGLISGDIGKLRIPNGEQRTIGGLDTWAVDKTRSIKEYFREWLATPPEFANTPFRRINREAAWRGENKWMDLANGGKKQRNIAYVINPNNCDELKPFLEYKVTPQTKNLRETIMGGGMTSGMYETQDYIRHTFVPVGVPANYIEKIIVGDKISQEEIREIKRIISELGLDVKV